MGRKKRSLGQDKVGWAFIAALLVLAGTSLVLRRSRDAGQEGLPRPAAPFSLAAMGGRALTLNDFAGQVLLLDYWATWCLECHEEQPTLISLYERFSEKGFSVLAVSVDGQGEKVVKPFLEKNPVPYPVAFSGDEPLKGYPVSALPTAYLIDRQGNIVRRYIGYKFFDRLSKDIQRIL